MKSRFVRTVAGSLSVIVVAGACASDSAEVGGGEGHPTIGLDPEPALTIGLDESRPETLFTRIADAAVMADGGVVVLDAATAELRAFDRMGELLWTAAGKGDGPAELSSATHLELLGDGRIGVADRLAGAMNFYSGGGEYLATAPVDQVVPGGRAIWMEGSPHPPIASGAVIVPAMTSTRFSADEQFQTGPRSTEILAANGDSVVVLFEYEAGVSYAIRRGDRIWMGDVPFTTGNHVDTGPSIAVAGNGRSPIRRFDGVAVEEIKPPFPARPITAAATSEYLTELGDGEGRSRAEDVLRNVELPDSTPNYDALLVDSIDRIWVRSYNIAGPASWSILGSTGAVVGVLELPEDARVLDANDAWLLVGRTSELDVQFVEVWRLPTAAGSGSPVG